MATIRRVGSAAGQRWPGYSKAQPERAGPGMRAGGAQCDGTRSSTVVRWGGAAKSYGASTATKPSRRTRSSWRPVLLAQLWCVPSPPCVMGCPEE